jgi:predicted nucleic acid-binding protein
VRWPGTSFFTSPLAETEAGLARAFLEGRILSVGEDAAELAAELFKTAGSKRRLKTDALIAAMAIRAKADCVTLNSADFEPFVSRGLRLFHLPASTHGLAHRRRVA